MAKYYYNGVLLPEIPGADYDGYTYKMILRTASGNVYIYATNSKPYYQRKSSVNRLELPGGRTRSLLNTELDAWGAANTSTSATYCDLSSNWSIIWSNFDIPSGSASATAVYFYGSVPIQAYDRKYLIRSNSTIYTVADGALVPLSDTEVSASLCRDYGVDELPDGSLLAGLTDLEVLYWHDSTDDLPALSLTVTGTPPVPQVVVTDAQDMSDSTILGIESVTVTASEDVLWAISFDDGATWKAHNGSQWVVLEQENSGMTAETFQNLSLEAWAEVVTSTAYRLRFVLMSPDSYVSEVVINYIN